MANASGNGLKPAFSYTALIQAAFQPDYWNGNGLVDLATDNVFRSFTITDGQLPIIGGVRNLNVPGDDDGATNGTIQVNLDLPGIDNVFDTAAGKFIYRVSDPASAFAPVTKPFTVAQKPSSQGIRGRITAASGGAALSGQSVTVRRPSAARSSE